MNPARKISTFDGSGFWKNAYVHQRAKLLRLAGVPEAQISGLADKRYSELSSDLRFDIETCGADSRDLR
ncbi:MAG: hypothetical protein EB829_02445 [Nitrosopumilus sp. H8]|nr:MAG: hypothetical protein EB830_00845 [Nitrosopumilus sp. H13]RNJ79289.1 MAG: hypothetical protein EB829_02445 [Nitrosopumilus sp. H8]